MFCHKICEDFCSTKTFHNFLAKNITAIDFESSVTQLKTCYANDALNVL